MNKDTQFKALLEKGIFLAERTIQQATGLLFQVDDFYVEIIFNREEEEIISTKSFVFSEELDPYLETIEISELL